MAKKILEVRETKKEGRGVFALKKIKKGTVIHRAEFIKVNDDDIDHCPDVAIYAFTYTKKYSALCLGIGALINHRPNPNTEVSFVKTKGRELMEFETIKDIAKGEQVFISYGGEEYGYKQLLTVKK
ncbi:MAG TPA: SET domain-containing protein-lysine N-methyltransferase [Flavobacteriales bacterium]|nr:SET domain-containing protein-lysine N-methyltransferase [Flavobacteriales bacterium]